MSCYRETQNMPSLSYKGSYEVIPTEGGLLFKLSPRIIKMSKSKSLQNEV